MHPRFSKFLLTTAALIALTARPAAAGPEGGWPEAVRPQGRARAGGLAGERSAIHSREARGGLGARL